MSSTVVNGEEAGLGLDHLGLFAGEGDFPVLVARAARSRGISVTAVGIEGLTSPDLASTVSAMHWVKFGKFDTAVRLLVANGVSKLILAGRIKHSSIFQLVGIDARIRRLLTRLATRKANSILGEITQELEKDGIEVLDSTIFLRDCMPKAGLLTPACPVSEEIEQDIEFGLEHARKMASLDIGQTVVVKSMSVVAVEAMEGTSETILRGGRIAGEGTVVVKVHKPNQDRRFDVPVLGLKTIHKMIVAHSAALAMAAEEVLLFDRQKVIELAEKHGISVIAV